MAPKKVMKVMKKQPLAKGKPKGKSLTKGRGILKHPLTKGKGILKNPLTKGKGSGTHSLKKANLNKLGKLTLAEKVQKASEGAESPEEAATNLKGLMSKLDKSKAWSKHNVHMSHQPAKDKKAFEKLTKTEKGDQVALFMVRTGVPRFVHWKESLSHQQSLDKREKWQSEQEMVQQFGAEEFWAHVQSGRVESREDPWTYGVWNYRDRGDIVKHSRMSRDKEYSRGQEYEAEEIDDEEFDEMMAVDNMSHLQKAETWGKALPKGSGKALTKGSGKGKGKGPLAIKDKEDEEEKPKEKTEAEEWKTLLGKAKRAKDQCASVQVDCQDAIEEAEKAKRLTKQSKKDSEAMIEQLKSNEKILKQLLLKKDKAMALEKAKQCLVDAGTALKSVKDEAKELRQLANKAGSSKAGSKK